MEHNRLEYASKTKWNHRLRSWIKAPIDNDEHYLEFELLALALATGIIDAVAFPKFHCFVSNQTGNTVLFAVTAFSLYGTRQRTDFTVPPSHLGTSLGCFCLGVFTAGQLSNRFDRKFSRWWLILTNIVQTIMVLLAALLNYVFHTSDKINTAPTICSIGLLAFASGAQVAMSRQLGMSEIPTTQATAAYVDLFVDPSFFAPMTANRGRNRRVAFLVTLCAGSFIGAPAYKYVSSAFAVFLAGVVKILVTVMFLFNDSR